MKRKERIQVGKMYLIFKSIFCISLKKKKKSGINAYLAVPVISGALVELLPQFEGDLSVLEGALGADEHLVALLADDDGGLGHVSHLPGGKAHAWTEWRRCRGLVNSHKCTTHFFFFFVFYEFSSITPRQKKFCKRGDIPTLTQGFHVLIEVLTVYQFPGGTEGVDHGEGFLGGRVTSKTHRAAAASAGFFAPLEVLSCFLSRWAPVWGGACHPIGYGDSP